MSFVVRLLSKHTMSCWELFGAHIIRFAHVDWSGLESAHAWCAFHQRLAGAAMLGDKQAISTHQLSLLTSLLVHAS